MGATLDEAGELRLWDLRQGSESVRLLITQNGTLTKAKSFLTDFSTWAVFGGAGPQSAVVALWDIPEQREVKTWPLGDAAQKEMAFLVQPPKPSAAGVELSQKALFLASGASGGAHLFI